MSMLLATLLAYGKLSSNSELLALKSLGYTNKRIIVPVVFLSFLMTGITFILMIALYLFQIELRKIL